MLIQGMLLNAPNDKFIALKQNKSLKNAKIAVIETEEDHLYK